MGREGLRILIGFALIWLVTAAPGLEAQTNDVSNAGVVFNFSTPGARSLAMGGAFLGSIDDASAAYSNPAGLLQLSEPEVAIEGRRWEYSVPFSDYGRASGQPTGNGVDTLGSVVEGRAESEAAGVSFASVVYPRPTWAGAVYYHQAAKFETSFFSGGIFGRFGNRLPPARTQYSLEIAQFGLAYAREWSNGIAAGLSLSAYQFELKSLTERFDPSGFGPPSFEQRDALDYRIQVGDATEPGFTLGFRWDRTPKTSVGVVYRHGPEFDLQARSAFPSPAVPSSQQLVLEDVTATFNLPDVFGFGLTYRPHEAVTVNLDLNRVRYSELIEDLHVFFDVTDPGSVRVEDYVLEDVTQLHLGVEYVVVNRWAPISLRAGAWHDPDHRLRAETGPELNQALFPEGEDQLHLSFGFGLNLGSRFQLDAAADFSDLYDTAALSLVYRF